MAYVIGVLPPIVPMLTDLLPTSFLTRHYSRPEGAVELCGDFLLHRLSGMAVQIEDHVNRQMPGTLLRNLRMHPSREKQGRMTVPQVVESNVGRQ